MQRLVKNGRINNNNIDNNDIENNTNINKNEKLHKICIKSKQKNENEIINNTNIIKDIQSTNLSVEKVIPIKVAESADFETLNKHKQSNNIF